ADDAARNVEVAAAVPAAQARDAIEASEPRPAAEPEEAAPKPSDGKAVQPAIYTVGQGESLWDIAREVLGDGHRFQEIIDLNPELKRYPDRLRPGQTLKMPQLHN